jgi:predicted homoserine dehydrogenase-like protein
VTAPIKKGELITYLNAAVDQSAKIVALRARQDAMLAAADAA